MSKASATKKGRTARLSTRPDFCCPRTIVGGVPRLLAEMAPVKASWDTFCAEGMPMLLVGMSMLRPSRDTFRGKGLTELFTGMAQLQSSCDRVHVRNCRLSDGVSQGYRCGHERLSVLVPFGHARAAIWSTTTCDIATHSSGGKPSLHPLLVVLWSFQLRCRRGDTFTTMAARFTQPWSTRPQIMLFHMRWTGYGAKPPNIIMRWCRRGHNLVDNTGHIISTKCTS
mmetsp:Transcript_4181/g.11661  ORF Transcript_4181/g.11661 Transcript_4181/m.11661 type:complete len:226 (+) Transcript_4181:418-1095(+)